MTRKPSVAVIGAGIIGSAIAYHLALRGADVMLLEEMACPGSGVTGRAFGWINTINGDPADPSYPLWRAAVKAHRDLRDASPMLYAAAKTGSLIWKASGDETERLAMLRREAGENVELLGGGRLAALESNLLTPPELAIFSPEDMALDPGQLAQCLTQAAVAEGARVLLGEKVECVEPAGKHPMRLRLSTTTVHADVVVMAAGEGVSQLAAGLGADLGLSTSPALLMRYRCSIPLVRHIIRSPKVEIRQDGCRNLLVAKSYRGEGGSADLKDVTESVLDSLREGFVLPADVSLMDLQVGRRPIFADGLPRFGLLPGVNGVYVAVGHPGVILAPLLGRLAVEEIIEGRRSAFSSQIAPI